MKKWQGGDIHRPHSFTTYWQPTIYLTNQVLLFFSGDLCDINSFCGCVNSGHDVEHRALRATPQRRGGGHRQPKAGSHRSHLYLMVHNWILAEIRRYENVEIYFSYVVPSVDLLLTTFYGLYCISITHIDAVVLLNIKYFIESLQNY